MKRRRRRMHAAKHAAERCATKIWVGGSRGGRGGQKRGMPVAMGGGEEGGAHTFQDGRVARHLAQRSW